MENIRWILLAVGVVIILGIYLFARLKTMDLSLPRRGRPKRVAPRHAAAPAMDDFDIDAGRDTAPLDTGELYAEDEPVTADEPVITITARPTRPAQEPQPVQAARPVQESQPVHTARPAQESRPVEAAHPAQEPQPVQTVRQTREPRPEVSPNHVFSVFVLAPHGVPFRGPLLLGALANAKLEHGDMQIFHRVEVVDGKEKTLFSAANIREPGTFDPAAMEHFTTPGLALFMQVHPGIDAVWAFEAMVEAARSLADSLGGTVCDASRSALTKQTIGHMRETVIGCQLQQRMAKAAS